MKNLTILQNYMASNSIDAFLLTISDDHQSEYVADYFNAVKHFTGFTGSSASLLVLPNKVYFWTDSRYFLQSETELKNKNIILVHQTNFNNGVAKALEDDICYLLSQNSSLYLQASFFSSYFFIKLKEATKSKNISIVINHNILNDTWLNRPALTFKAIYNYAEKFSGVATSEKISLIKSKMLSNNYDYYLVSSLDDIAYITNLRGSDIPYNPVFFAYLLFSQTNIYLFVNLDSIDINTKTILAKNFVLKDYNDFSQHILSLKNATIFLDTKRNNSLIYHNLESSLTIQTGLELIEELKISKNQTELDYLKIAHQKDGIAMVKFLKYMSENQSTQHTDFELSNLLTLYRMEDKDFVMLSFSPIVSFNADATIVHRSVSSENKKAINGSGLLLLDTGSHYMAGTTDISRTIGIKNPSDKQKYHYTLVLKAHIMLASTIFPKNTPASSLDALARYYLWQHNLNYGHGTGHGVGAMLSVHEGQTRISSLCHNSLPLNFVCSIEPGLYLTGEYGIRIENLYYTSNYDDSGDFLKFNVLTLCPLDNSLLDKSLLTKNEIDFINSYHEKVYNELQNLLDDETKKFLKQQTKAITYDE